VAVRRTPTSLVPPAAARLAGLAALALVGGLEWRRMVDGVGLDRVALWVLVAVGSAAALLFADRRRRHRDAATFAVCGLALAAAVASSGIPLKLLKPARWDQLADGLRGGLEALGGVWLPYAGADPWPGLTIQFLGAVLCALAGLLAFWPRDGGSGHLFVALAALLALVITPVVSLGASQPLLLGVVLTAGTVCFLWLERLPLRPGLGLGALLGVAIAGAVALAGVADRERPWWDYQSFAEGLGPTDPVRFSWKQSYGPMSWPRTHAEVMRVTADDPAYWKLRTLEEFDGVSWYDRVESGDPRRLDPSLDLPYVWRGRRDWTVDAQVSLRRLRAPEVVGPGTVLRVTHSTRAIRPAGEPGGWRGVGDFRGGDSYDVQAYVPRPSSGELAGSMSGRHADELGIRVPILGGGPAWLRTAAPSADVQEAIVRFRPFRQPGAAEPSSATYPAANRSGDGAEALRSSAYARTWALARQLRADAQTPYEYVARVAAHLADGYDYAERPPAPAPGRAPLDAFLFDSRRGYCQHFAGAMALLLRMGGIPARVAVGFTPGGFSERKDAWIVRDTDAHAWVEAWFDRYGWVALDPTPTATPARSQIALLTPTGGPDALIGGALGTEGATRQGASREPRGGPRTEPSTDPAAGDGAGGAGGEGGGAPWWVWALGGAAGAVALLRLLVLRRRRRRARDDRAWRVDRAVAELEAALRRSGRGGAPGLTLRQLEQRLAGTPEAVAYLRALRSGRYGPARAVAELPTAAQRRALRRALAAGGGLRARLRALWALPPWRR
jgi:protein-glutamine gamma-glutamyltransferase